jgi:hypothetical protein
MAVCFEDHAEFRARNRAGDSRSGSAVLGVFTLFLNGDTRCGSKTARRRCRVFFPKERIRHGVPEEQANRGRKGMPNLYTSTG